MPITAFSKGLARELDVEQWISLAATLDPLVSADQDRLRVLTSQDVECSCCGARGAVIVAGARSGAKARRQAHFRFIDPSGGNPHRPLCDFVREGSEGAAEHLIDFSEGRSALTQAVRDLVCRGLAHGLFTQAQMREMRLWFLQTKQATAFRMDVSDELLDWCADFHRAQHSWAVHMHFPFEPIHGMLPNFDWTRAARAEWVRRQQVLQSLTRGPHWHLTLAAVGRAKSLAHRFAGQLVFDASTLETQYQSAIAMSRFVVNHLSDAAIDDSPFRTLSRKHDSDWGDTIRHTLLAFSALLLYLSGWDQKAAAALFVQLRIRPKADWREGNLIGLNPFHDFAAWRALVSAKAVGQARQDVRPVAEQVAEVEAEMRAASASWLAGVHAIR